MQVPYKNKNRTIMHPCMLSCFSCVRLCAALWLIARQAPLSMGFSRQEHWSGLSCPPPEGLPDPGIKPTSLRSPALAGGFFTTSATWEAQNYHMIQHFHFWVEMKTNSKRCVHHNVCPALFYNSQAMRATQVPINR